MAKVQSLSESVTLNAKPYAFTFPPRHTALVVIDMVWPARVFILLDTLMVC